MFFQHRLLCHHHIYPHEGSKEWNRQLGWFSSQRTTSNPHWYNPSRPLPAANHWRGIRAPEHVVEADPTGQNNSYKYRRANETLRSASTMVCHLILRDPAPGGAHVEKFDAESCSWRTNAPKWRVGSDLTGKNVIYAYKCPFGPIQSLSLVMKPSQITIVHHRVGPVERRVGRNFPPQNSRKKCKKRTRFGLSKGIKRKSMVLSNIWNRSIDQITSVCHAILLLRMQRQITIFP